MSKAQWNNIVGITFGTIFLMNSININRQSESILLSLTLKCKKVDKCMLKINKRYHPQTQRLELGAEHPHITIHAVCHLPCTVKTGIHPWRKQLSKVPNTIKCEHLPTRVGYNDELQSGRDPDEDDEHADELPWDGFWQFVQKLFGYANRLLQQLFGWLVSDNLGGEDAGCGGPGLVWLHVVCGCEAGWMYCQILWNAFGDGLW